MLIRPHKSLFFVVTVVLASMGNTVAFAGFPYEPFADNWPCGPIIGIINGGGCGHGQTLPAPATSDPVYLHNGEFYLDVTDLEIPGRGIDFEFTRKYRSRFGFNSVMGDGWDHSYNLFLEDVAGDLRFYSGTGREEDVFTDPGTTGTFAKDEFLRTLVKNGDDTFTMTTRDLTKFNFASFDPTGNNPGMITSIVDRNGNTMTFSYYTSGTHQGKLETITDTLGRDIDFAYGTDGYLKTVTDFSGRVVTFTHYTLSDPNGSIGDLATATSPAVTGTPNGNNYPSGKTVTYTYDANSRLKTITDAKGQQYLENFYVSDKVVEQIYGGDHFNFYYDAPLTPTPPLPASVASSVDQRTIINNRRGHVKELFYNSSHQLVATREYTGTAPDATIQTTDAANRPTGKLRSADPDFYETLYFWNVDSWLTKKIMPNGNQVEFEYELDLNPSATRLERGNLREKTRTAGTHTPQGDQTKITEKYEYNTSFGGCCGANFVTKYTDGRGNETVYTYDPTTGDRLTETDVTTGIVHTWTYNSFGQVLTHTLPSNGTTQRVDSYSYYTSGPQTGYLHKQVVDDANLKLTTTFDYDLVGNVVNVQDPKGNDTQYVINQLNEVVRTITRDVDGSGTRYQVDSFFDANGKLEHQDVQNIDENGVVLANSHFTTSYEYDILDNLIAINEEVSSTASITTEYAYDENENLIQIKFGEATNGNQTTNTMDYVFDERDLLFEKTWAKTDADETAEQSVYDGNGNLTKRLEGPSSGFQYTTNYVHDGYDRLYTVTDANLNERSFNYDANSNVEIETVNGELLDNPTTATNVQLFRRVNAFDALNRLTRVDVDHFVVASGANIGDGLATTIIEYNDNSQPWRIEDDRGHDVDFRYDTANRLKNTRDILSNDIAYTYDANSNILAVLETDQHDTSTGLSAETFTTDFTYDGLDRQLTTIDNNGNVVTNAYDSRSNLVKQINARGNVTRNTFDGLNRLTRTERDLTNTGTGGGTVTSTVVVQQEWDDTSRLVASIDDNGNEERYTYDALNRRIEIERADCSTWQFDYDDFHDPVIVEDPNGTIVANLFDFVHRLRDRFVLSLGAGVSGNTINENFSYDGFGRLVETSDNTSIYVDWTYDSLSNPLTETLNGETATAEYDALGNMTKCIYPSGRIIETAYDELNRKQTIDDTTGGTTLTIADYLYAGPSRVHKRTMGNNTEIQFTYDGITGVPNPIGDSGVKQVIKTRHVATAGHATPGAIMDSRDYLWDENYNKLKRTNEIAGVGITNDHTYVYDSLDRLGSVNVKNSGSGTTVRSTEYPHDGVHNRLAVVSSIGSSPADGAYTMGGAGTDPCLIPNGFFVNEYDSTPAGTRTHDANGNVVTIGADTMVYDFRNRMVEYYDASTGFTHEYVYDPLDRRIEKAIDVSGPTDTLQFYYFAPLTWQEIEEHEQKFGPGTRKVKTTYVYGNGIDEILLCSIGVLFKTNRYYLSDDMGNVVMMTDEYGTILEQYAYDDYGAPSFFDAAGTPMAGSANGGQHLFNGRRFDPETGLYYYRTRYMKPEDGRFLTLDTIGVWGDPNNLGNGYTYVGNNPWTFVDPFGLLPMDAGPSWDLGPGTGGKLREKGFKPKDLHPRGTEKGGKVMVWVTVGGVMILIPGPEELIVAGIVARGARVGGAIVKGAKAVDKATDAAKAADKAGDAAKAADKASDAKKAADKVGDAKKGGGCFVRGTFVVMADGSLKPIELIEPGDLVAADFDPVNQDGAEYSLVVETFVAEAAEVVDILFEDDDGNSFSATATLGHPFYVPSQNGYVLAGNLDTNMCFLSAEGRSYSIASIDMRASAVLVYNFHVLGAKNYFIAGANGEMSVLVHNGSAQKPKKADDDLPTLDPTGKVHGKLPKPEDLRQYSKEELEQLMRELNQSVQERIRQTNIHGADAGHSARIAAEQQLIHSIKKYLKDLCK